MCNWLAKNKKLSGRSEYFGKNWVSVVATRSSNDCVSFRLFGGRIWAVTWPMVKRNSHHWRYTTGPLPLTLLNYLRRDTQVYRWRDKHMKFMQDFVQVDDKLYMAVEYVFYWIYTQIVELGLIMQLIWAK